MGFLVEESNRGRGRVRNFCLGGQVAALIYLSRQSPPHPKHTHTHTKASIKDHKQREAKGRFLGPGMGGKKLTAKWIPCWGKKKKISC